MKNDFFKLLMLYCLTTVLFFSSHAQSLPDSIPLRVVIIRHGEKPVKGFNLSCQGYNRSLQLPKVLTTLFGVPDFTYVPSMRSGKTIKSVRMYQTVVPLAVQYDININTNYDEVDTTSMVEEIRQKRGTVLIVWDLKNILPIVRNFGITKTLSWDATDFDTIWIIDFIKTKAGELLPKLSVTKENINPSPECK